MEVEDGKRLGRGAAQAVLVVANNAEESQRHSRKSLSLSLSLPSSVSFFSTLQRAHISLNFLVMTSVITWEEVNGRKWKGAMR